MQRVFQRVARRDSGRKIFQFDLSAERRTLVIVGEIGANGEILDVNLFFADKVNITEDPRRPPHVLVFNVSRIGPLHHTYREQVFALLCVGRNVELCSKTAAFTKTDIVAVDVHLEVGFHAIELDDGLFVVPLRAQCEGALISARWVVGGYKRHVNWEWETFVCVLKIAVAFHLPHVWYGNVFPVVHCL